MSQRHPSDPESVIPRVGVGLVIQCTNGASEDGGFLVYPDLMFVVIAGGPGFWFPGKNIQDPLCLGTIETNWEVTSGITLITT